MLLGRRAWSWRTHDELVPYGLLPFQRKDRTIKPWDQTPRIEGGEFVVIVGPSGCGKSTLLRLIDGLEAASEGEVLIGGRNVTSLDPAARCVAMVFQSYALYPHLSVRENIAFPLRMAKRPKVKVDAKVAAVADMLELTPLLDRRPRELSGGQRHDFPGAGHQPRTIAAQHR